MRKAISAGMCLAAVVGSTGAAEEPKDYVGPFPTQALYRMCKEPASHDKCRAYLQGLIYGIQAEKSMTERGSPVCLPDISSEQARLQLLQFIDTTTGGKPATNQDSGDWVAFLSLAAGHLCKK